MSARKYLWAVVAISLALIGCSSGTPQNGDREEVNMAGTITPAPIGTPEKSGTDLPQVEIVMENGDVMVAELYPEIAPITVANFLKLVESNFYSGLIFHRVIPGFMIQGGGMDANGQMRAADSIKGEFTSNGVENNLKHTRGVLSMARTSVKDSASSQFFVMTTDSPHLDGEYASFGKVISGMNVADAIVNQPRDGADKPLAPQVIKTIRKK